MNNNELLDIYSDYLISAFGLTTATGLATLLDGGRWRNRIQTYDSTFTLEPTDAINNLHVNGVLSPIPSLPAVRVFDDCILNYDPANPQGSVKNPTTGTQVRIQSISARTALCR